MKKLIIGNWKMNGTLAQAQDLCAAVLDGVRQTADIPDKAELAICPPFLHLAPLAQTIRDSGLPLALGAQDCSAHPNGAFTGDVSAAMLKDLGCSYVILGHSERRQYYYETDAAISQKAGAAHKQGLKTIICVGETAFERAEGLAESIVEQQLAVAVPDGADGQNTVIAYEPVWAIGTGKTATPEDAAAMHDFIRRFLVSRHQNGHAFRIVYGGSMKPENARALLSQPHINGGLIGGASLDASQFLAIAKS